jgi:hypothetical protein
MAFRTARARRGDSRGSLAVPDTSGVTGAAGLARTAGGVSGASVTKRASTVQSGVFPTCFP